ncbi:MAG: transposase [Rhodobacteraceae bacterium]|nr:transposase [Paracoccaceae bacterium]
MHLAVDATGLKVYGEGEWKVRVHGKDKRRVWRKLHLAVDTGTGALHAHALTVSEASDGGERGPARRTAAPVAAVCADKAYDSFDGHAAILARDARAGDPPRKGAAIRRPPRRQEVPHKRRVGGRHRRGRARRLEGRERRPPPRPRAAPRSCAKKRRSAAPARAVTIARGSRPPSPCAASTASPPLPCPVYCVLAFGNGH